MALEPERSPGVPGVSGMGVRRAADSAGGMAVPAQWLHEQYVVRRRSSQDLAAETGWSSQYIRDRLRDAGIPVRPAGASKAAGLDPRQLAEWLAEGLPVAAIAERAGYSRSGVYKLMREHALTAVPRPPDPAEEQLATECGRLYRQGLTLRAIARRVGRGEQWVRARVLDAGVPLRCGGPTPVVVGRHALREAIAGGASVAEIAERFNRSTTVVRGWLRAAGIERPAPRVRRGPQLPLLDADVLRRLYVDERFVIAEIATQLGVSADRIRTGLIAAGIPRRRPGHRDDVPAPPTITAKQLRVLYVRGGLSMVEVAAKLGTSDTRVRAALDRHGIAARPYTRRAVPPLDVEEATLRSLYVEQHLDDEQIAQRYGVPPYRVRLRLRELGIQRPTVNPPRPPPAVPPPRAELARLYCEQGRTLEQIARAHHTSSPVVRGWLLAAGVAVRERTSRSHRKDLDIGILRTLYVDREWSAADVAAELDSTLQLVLRTLHDHGIPVRRGGSRRSLDAAGDSKRLLEMLYGDPEVTDLLARHRIPERPEPGAIAERFPTPMRVSDLLLREAYLEVGLAARHIELLTGQPAGQVLDALHACGTPVRASGLSPWLSRQLG